MRLPQPAQQEHILVLDDDEGILRLQRKVLERAGYRVSATTSPEQATLQVATSKPDLLLLDYNLGVGQTGLDVYTRLRAQGMDAPAILVTGFSDEGRAIEALRAGVRDVIPKVGDYLDYLPDAVTRLIAQLRAGRALAEAQAASRAKDRFLAILSHELRTPLTPVLTAVHVLQGFDLPPEAQNILQLIRRNVELEARLIDDLLDVTRISGGKLQLQQTRTDLHEKLMNALQIVENDVRGKRLVLTVELLAKKATVIADPTRLQQVFWNLLKNAVKFTPEGGEVAVRSSETADGRVRIEITDTGIGIAAESIERIFQAFEQGGQQITKQFGGLGLGLSIAKALTEAHGGRIFASSGGIGKGASFAVELPLATEAQGQASATPSFPPGAASSSAPAVAHILLVEDHRDTATMMSMLLRRDGHRVSIADSVAAALQIAGCERVDVVISDIGLPDGSGLDLMRQLRDRHVIKGIALSGFGMEEDILRSRDAGFIEHLVKPFQFDQLRSVLSRVVRDAG